MFGLEPSLAILLIISIVAVCIFEFVNGFHDTANAVATVIYTGTLKPSYAVVWSGFCNFLGLMIGVGSGLKVAMGIVDLLPLADLASVNLYDGVFMVISILIGAIIWNVGTWYFGIPCSSSHTLIGSILGAGIVFFLTHQGVSNVNWKKASEIGMSLLISPMFGFACSIILMFVGRQIFKKEERKFIFKEPVEGSVPPTWLRAILVTTCTGVSYFHGSNDGQKGVGLVLIILMAFFPLQYALTPNYNDNNSMASIVAMEQALIKDNKVDLVTELNKAKDAITKHQINPDKKEKFEVRKTLTKLTKRIKEELTVNDATMSKDTKKILKDESKKLKTYFILEPSDIYWVMIMIALSIGIGTMIGWKRIVVTIGEKIGKRHMTYAEGATAEIVAAGTIGLSTGFGLPVSTTHVLSSGVAGAMTASKGVKNLQAGTIKSIALAWLLTLPVTMILSGLFYWIFRFFL